MRSLTFPQTNVNNPAFLNFPYSMNPTYLTPLYMNMFDPFKPNTELLGKRPMFPYANPSQADPQKRLKTSLGPNGFVNPYYQQCMTNLMSQAIPNSNPFARETQCKSEGTKQEEILSYSQEETNQTQYSQDESVYVKEEYIKLEESDVKQETVDSNQSPLNHSENLTELNGTSEANTTTPNKAQEGLSLVDLTKVYPDWDLVTIVRHIESDKPAAPFGISQRIKLRRKKNKPEPVFKELKTHRRRDTDGEYRPGKNINVKFRHIRKEKKKTNN